MATIETVHAHEVSVGAWRETFHRGSVGFYMAEVMHQRGQQIERIREWADRHAVHAGHAPLSELRDILNGGDTIGDR